MNLSSIVNLSSAMKRAGTKLVGMKRAGMKPHPPV